MIGAAALVPPNLSHLLTPAEGAKTLTPVAGSATAETSATVRRVQIGSVCQSGRGMYAEQPLPAPDQTVSVQPRVFEAVRSDVPPTAVTYRVEAGNSAP